MFFLSSLVGLALAPAPTLKASPSVAPSDGMVIRKSVTLKPGIYRLPKGLKVTGDGVTIEAAGVTLIGAATGQALLAENVSGLTVRGLGAQHYRWGIKVRGGRNITVKDCRIRDTAEETPADGVWLDIWRKPEQAYGAAILLWNVKGGAVSGNDVQHQQNGISLYSCSGVTVEKNNASFQSGWGIHLYDSSDNVIQDNLADWCNRIHKRGERYYYPGADAAGMLMVWNSSRNVVRRNMFRGGGDGVFVAGYNAPDSKVPCNDNIFEDNDGSYSPNNAFESTFCKGNIFRRNRANASNYGFWLGYSTDNRIEGNEVRRNRIAGIAVEHGLRNTYVSNSIAGNSRGIALWSRSPGGFLSAFPDQAASAGNFITANTFSANGIGFLSRRDGEDARANPHNDTLADNLFYGNGTGALLMTSDAAALRGNRFEENTTGLRLEGCAGAEAAGNYFLKQPTHAWSDTAGLWSGNYWGGTDGKAYTIAGPAACKDESPLSQAPAAPEGRLMTEDQILRATPR
jgi:parallel beta-helix repeat protein